MFTTSTDTSAIEIIRDKLYWISASRPPTSSSTAYYFSVDNDLLYEPFHKDFGPLSLAKTHKYVRETVRLLSDPMYKDVKIYHHCSTNFEKKANAVFLMGAFMIAVLKQSAETVCDIFESCRSQLVPFRDASYGNCSYECTVYHCLKGLEIAIRLGWYKFREFDPKEYEYYEKVENGDLNWIIPNKFIAFMGPVDNNMGKRGNTPEDYLQVFNHFGVSHVVRLNEPKYDKQKFIKHGIKHTDLFFIDGSTPSDKIVNDFLRLSERENGVVAVHCKAGLGRTGTLIGCYAMKHFKIPAAFFIGWIRIARPGSILGPQQYYLIEKEAEMIGISNLSRDLGMLNLGEMSPEDKRKSMYGDRKQGDKLVKKKFMTPSHHTKAYRGSNLLRQ